MILRNVNHFYLFHLLNFGWSATVLLTVLSREIISGSLALLLDSIINAFGVHDSRTQNVLQYDVYTRPNI